VSHDTAVKNDGILQITLNLAGAAFLSGLIIAGVYFVTAPVAAEQRIVMRNNSMKELVPDASAFKPLEGKTGWFTAEKDNRVEAYVVPGEGKGYGGTIKMLVAVKPDGSLIGYKVLAHNETPGLGDRTTQPKFRAQYAGKTVKEMFLTKDSPDGKIDAIAGVTISSRAITKAVREALTTLGESTTQQGTAP
jgi:electron transport complex protein RnfG